MSSVKKKLVLQEPATPSPKKFKFFTPERLRPVNIVSATNYNESELEMTRVKESITKCKIGQLLSVAGIETYLTSQCGLNKAMLIFQSLYHVPVGFPQRIEYVTNILVTGGLKEHFVDLKDALQHIDNICNSQSYSAPISEELLWKTSLMVQKTHMGFLMPKVEMCLEEGCRGKLYGSKKDTIQVTVFTLNGPVPFLKATLSCRKCRSR